MTKETILSVKISMLIFILTLRSKAIRDVNFDLKKVRH